MDELKKQRDENFKELGQCLLQKKYYEERIERLLKTQEKLCHQIYNTRID